MSKNHEFIKNTIILFIGKFATQFTSLLLLPLYTHFLLANDYGHVDLLQTYITLFVPLLTLRLDSAAFRFLIDKRKDKNGKKSIITNILLITAITILLTIIICIILSFIIEIKYLNITIINLIILMLSNVLLQIMRGLGKIKEYSIASIITAIITITINVILIIGFNYNADSILISSSIANIGIIIYIICSCKLYRYIKIKEINRNVIKKILVYSIPMIPNSLSWWIVNVSDRTIISIFLGTALNGIYTVSCKLSNLINSVFSIFNMSWQETASLHINDEDKNNIFSNFINKLFMLFACGALCINSALPIFYNIIIGNEYMSAYNYIPILLYANLWNIMINLIGGIYIALKKTKEIANTTIISALINLVINLILIKHIGLYAAAISTLIAYFVMSIYRYYDCKKYINLKINFKRIIILTLIFTLSTILYYINNIYLNILNIIIAIVYSLIINKFLINIGINYIKKLKK